MNLNYQHIKASQLLTDDHQHFALAKVTHHLHCGPKIVTLFHYVGDVVDMSITVVLQINSV